MHLAVCYSVLGRCLAQSGQFLGVTDGPLQVTILRQIVIQVVLPEITGGLLVAGHISLEVGQHIVARIIMLGGNLWQEMKQEPELGTRVGLNPNHIPTAFLL